MGQDPVGQALQKLRSNRFGSRIFPRSARLHQPLCLGALGAPSPNDNPMARLKKGASGVKPSPRKRDASAASVPSPAKRPAHSATPSVASASSRKHSSAPTEATAAKKQKTGGRVSHSCCQMCFRSFDAPNPLTKGTMSRSSTLPRAKGYGPKCDICTYSWSWASFTGDIGHYVQELQADEPGGEKRSKWMEVAHGYGDYKNGVALREGVAAPATREGPLTHINQREDVQIVRDRVVSHFWPVDTFTQHFGVKPVPELVVEDFDADGAHVIQVCTARPNKTRVSCYLMTW